MCSIAEGYGAHLPRGKGSELLIESATRRRLYSRSSQELNYIPTEFVDSHTKRNIFWSRSTSMELSVSTSEAGVVDGVETVEVIAGGEDGIALGSASAAATLMDQHIGVGNPQEILVPASTEVQCA